jgi:hypothetical protein
MGTNPYTVRSGVGWPDFDQDLQRQILDLAEPPASFTVQYFHSYKFDEDNWRDYRYVKCEITWCFARRRKDIFTSELEVTLTRRVLPDDQPGEESDDQPGEEPDDQPGEEPDEEPEERGPRPVWRDFTDDERTACVQRFAYEHRWSDVVNITFIPQEVCQYAWNHNPFISWDIMG